MLKSKWYIVEKLSQIDSVLHCTVVLSFHPSIDINPQQKDVNTNKIDNKISFDSVLDNIYSTFFYTKI